MASPTTVPAKVRQQFLTLLTTLDTSALRLSTILSTPAGVDKFLLTIQYTMKLLFPQIARLRALRLSSHLTTILIKPSQPLPSASPNALTVLRVDRLDTLLAGLDKSSRALAAVISDARIFLRLWLLLTMYRWGRGTYLAPPADRVVKALTWAQIGSSTLCQALESTAYLAGKGVLPVAPAKVGKMWLWSARFWAGYCALEGVRLLRVKSQKKALGEKQVGGPEEASVKKEEEEAWTRSWYVNAGYAPMAAHYSLAKGPLSEDVLGFLGLVVSWNTFRHMWKTTVVA